ncbi:MAG: glycine cleavage system protein H [Thermodesulfobacteriota bacterium]|nr:glycine cleavage system protein H [Thermodesulfobacteriota bacterium]
MKSSRSKNRQEGRLDPCIWMQAGVVRRKSCKNNYDCSVCRFDRIMQRTADGNNKLIEAGEAPRGKRSRIVSWKDKLSVLPKWKRPCVHHLKGRIDFRACTNQYSCGSCDFDQCFDEQYSVYALVKPVDVLDVKGFKIPQGYYLHRGHTWARIEEGSSVRIGIDDFASRLLGPLDRIEAPLMGKEIEQDSPDITVFRGEHHARMLSPVSGVVTATNPKLRAEGIQANADPFSEGWLMTVHASDLRKDLKGLMISSETEDFIGEQADRLYQVIEEVAGPLTADGGNLGNDIYGNMPQLGWDRLARLFLRT